LLAARHAVRAAPAVDPPNWLPERANDGTVKIPIRAGGHSFAGVAMRRTMSGRRPATTDRRRMLEWAAAGAASLLATPLRRASAQNASPAPVPGTVVGAAGVNIRACARVECPVRVHVRRWP
jgi:hypothetical protein